MASIFQAHGHTTDEMIEMVTDETPHVSVTDEHSLEDEYQRYQNAREKVELALQAPERMAFAIGNLNFSIQGVCVAAIVNNAISICSVWFACVISVLTGLPNLVALFLVGVRYRELVDFHGSVLRRGRGLESILTDRFPERYGSGSVRDAFRYTAISLRTPLIGKNATLFIGAVHVAFSVVVAFSPLIVICRHHEGVKK